MLRINQFHSFLVGEASIEQKATFKTAILRGYITLVPIAISILYFFIDSYNNLDRGQPYYIIVVVFSLLSLYLNRKQRYTAANFVLLSTTNAIIFLFAASDIHRMGIQIFIVTNALAALVLFGINKIYFGFFFFLVSITLFFVAYFFPFSVIPTSPYNNSQLLFNFSVNFCIGVGACALVTYSLMRTNHIFEKSLLTTTDELTKSRNRTDMVLESVNAGIYEWYTNTGAIEVSPAWKKLLGYEANEIMVVDMDFYFSILHPDDHTRAQQIMNTHFQTQAPYSNEVRMRKKDGEYIWLLDSGQSKFDVAGKPIVTIGSIINVNERKQAEEQVRVQNDLLQKANKELDQFVYSVSHDLRAPLSSIQGLTTIYNLTNSQEERDTIVKLITDRSVAMDTFIKDVLQYSRNARTEVLATNVQLYELVQQVCDGLTFMTGFTNTELILDINKKTIVVTDGDRLKVILSNLIGNAIKYSKPYEKTNVTVRAGIHTSGWFLKVEDNGIGIAQEHQAKVFNMFYQANESGNGTGLGLYIVQEAVQKLQGHISLQSELGIGTSISIVFDTLHTREG